MIMWENIRYDLNKASTDFTKLNILDKTVEPIIVKEEFVVLRNKFIAARDEVFEEYNLDASNKLDYHFDLVYGLKVYEILTEEVGFVNRVATNDDVWRYLSICVIPDIVHARWGLNADHFYKTSRRIWLKTIWWYIDLSWRGNVDDTYEILKGNSTDTILQLVERPGIGYYNELYREIMLQYASLEDSSRNWFRRALKLNTARLITTSPELVDGGTKKYVEELFETTKE